jgi:hypothetical protein
MFFEYHSHVRHHGSTTSPAILPAIHTLEMLYSDDCIQFYFKLTPKAIWGEVIIRPLSPIPQST